MMVVMMDSSNMGLSGLSLLQCKLIVPGWWRCYSGMLMGDLGMNLLPVLDCSGVIWVARIELTRLLASLQALTTKCLLHDGMLATDVI
jgi:hypothetical protein